MAAAVGGVYTFGASNEARDNKIKENSNELARLDAKIEAVNNTQAENWTMHLQLHKDHLGDVKERDGRYEQRFASIEKEQRRTNQLELRVSLQEKQQVDTSNATRKRTRC